MFRSSSIEELPAKSFHHPATQLPSFAHVLRENAIAMRNRATAAHPVGRGRRRRMRPPLRDSSGDPGKRVGEGLAARTGRAPLSHATCMAHKSEQAGLCPACSPCRELATGDDGIGSLSDQTGVPNKNGSGSNETDWELYTSIIIRLVLSPPPAVMLLPSALNGG